MTDLNEMWAALAQYQPYADKRGFGAEWRTMCEERTEKSARAAKEAALARLPQTVVEVAVAVAAHAAEMATVVPWVKQEWAEWAEWAVSHIRDAISYEKEESAWSEFLNRFATLVAVRQLPAD